MVGAGRAAPGETTGKTPRSNRLSVAALYALAGLLVAVAWLTGTWRTELDSMPVVRYARVDCPAARDMIAEAERGGAASAPVVLLASDLSMRPGPGSRPAVGERFVLECEGVTLQAAGAVYPGEGELRSSGVTALLVRAEPAGLLQVLQLCAGCEDPSMGAESAAESRLELLRVAGTAGAVAAFALLLAARRRRRPRLASALGPRAPGEREPGLPSVEPVRLGPLDGGEAVLLEAGQWTVGRAGAKPAGAADLPRLVVPAARVGFRERPGAGPVLVGPGAVNGLAVGRGEEAALADGDVVRLGGRRCRLEAPACPPGGLRYHFAGEGRLALLTPASGPTAWTFASAGLLLLGPVGFGLASMEDGLAPWAALPGALAAALGLVLLPPAARLERRTVELVAPSRARLTEGPRGSYELVFESPEGRAPTVERVPERRLFASSEELALQWAMLEEARALAQRFGEDDES